MFENSAGDRPDIPNGLIVITDSNSNINVNGISEASSELKDEGTTVFSIGIGLENPDEIVSVASNQEFSYILNDVAQLPAITRRLQDRLPSIRPFGISGLSPAEFSNIWSLTTFIPAARLALLDLKLNGILSIASIISFLVR
jgi:hypothetical protein